MGGEVVQENLESKELTKVTQKRSQSWRLEV